MLSRTPLLLLFAVVSPAYAQTDGRKLKEELAELQGVWRLIGFEIASS